MTGTHAGINDLDVLWIQPGVFLTDLRKLCLHLRLLLGFIQIVPPIFFKPVVGMALHPQAAQRVFHHVLDDPIGGKELGGGRDALLGDFDIFLQQGEGVVLQLRVVVLI